MVEGRDLPEEEVRAVADGRVITGEEAEELGLVDELGNFYDAVDLAMKEAGQTGRADAGLPARGRGPLPRAAHGRRRAGAVAQAVRAELAAEAQRGPASPASTSWSR